MTILEAQYIQRMHPTIHFSIYLHNSCIKTYMLFYFVCPTKGEKNIDGVVRKRKIENKWTLETGSNRVIGKNYIINSLIAFPL
jgi:hypothetical protein